MSMSMSIFMFIYRGCNLKGDMDWSIIVIFFGDGRFLQFRGILLNGLYNRISLVETGNYLKEQTLNSRYSLLLLF